MCSVSDEENHKDMSPVYSPSVHSPLSEYSNMIPTSSTADDSLVDSRSPGGGKQKRRDDGTKVCGVCADKAFGVNFEAICCESCKAFFRRNALKEKSMKCLFTGNCTIDRHTRRFCPHCRLKKCIAIGMKKTNILGAQEKRQRMEKVLENRQRRHDKLKVKVEGSGVEGAADGVVADVVAAAVAVDSPPLVTVSATSTTFTVDPTDLVTLPLADELPTQQPTLNSCITQSLAQHMPGGRAAGVMAAAALDEPLPVTNNLLSFCRYATMVDPTGVGGSATRRLTADELDAIQELVDVYDLSFTIDLEPLIHLKQIDPSLNQLVNQSSITVLRIIKFAKRLGEFAQLDQGCQIGILKASWIHVLLLRSVSLYDASRDVWVTPKGDIPTEILKNATGYVELHGEHVAYSKTVKAIIGDDLTIVVIMLAIVLFSPEGAHVAAARQLIANVQDKYIVLLKHYLESRYGFGSGGADMFPLVMAKLRELKQLAEGHGKYLLDVNPREIEPIMLEILDLK